jgi:DNA repair exonuclease SbcCD nuclease subunit
MIVIPGDFFHTKWQLSTEALIKANNIMNSLLEVTSNVVIIRGNHDSASSMELDVNLCENYKKIPGVIVVNDTSYIDIGGGARLHFVAYAEGEELKKRIHNCKVGKPNDEQIDILFGHFAVQGFKMNGDYEDKDGLKQTNLLNAFKQVFLGHFHGHQHAGNVWYISSPLQSKHGDEASKHGYMFYDTKTDEAEFVENKLSPKFITYDMTKQNVRDALSLKNHYIRFIVYKHVSRDLLTSVRQKLLVNNYDVEYKFNIKDDVLQFTSMDGFVDLKHYSIDELFTIYLQEIQPPTNTTIDELLEAILS